MWLNVVRTLHQTHYRFFETTLTPIGLEVLVLKICEIKRIESPLKLDKIQA